MDLLHLLHFFWSREELHALGRDSCGVTEAVMKVKGLFCFCFCSGIVRFPVLSSSGYDS